MTLGQMMFYGGIALIAAGIILLGVCVPLFASQRRKMEKKIQNDYV